VAALLADSGQIVLVPAISPLAEHREMARRIHEEAGLKFYEVFCATPIKDCERRDPKGLYAKARAGEIKEFTGIDSPYEVPEHPDLLLVPGTSTEELAQQVVELLGSRR
jgi:bifunctional enzyme CysN/CysC